MRASISDRYGPAESVTLTNTAKPRPKDGEVLVKVTATTVNAADWRMRSAQFPKGMWLMGRLMSGVFRPRRKVLGSEFAGFIEALGPGVDAYRVGDRVFGMSEDRGAHADYLVMPVDGALAPTPPEMSDEDAVSLPFGTVCALVFLHDHAGLRPRQRLLITGASGGVGAFAVQVARHLGAEITALASEANHVTLQSLGADLTIDYNKTDITKSGLEFDVVLDTVGMLGVAEAKRLLVRNGVFLPLEFGVPEMIHALTAKLFGGPKIVLGVSVATKTLINRVAALARQGVLRPVIDSRYPFEDIAEAYRRAETRHKTGSIVVVLSPPRLSDRAA